METIRRYLIKYREIIVYIITGVLTTIVSWAACFVCKMFLDPDVIWQNYVINSIGWIAGVLFAYPLNRKWVFKSENPHIMKEFLGFASSRLFTYFLEIAIMLLTVNALGISYWIAKIFIAAVAVTILNYIFGKLLIFKRKDLEKEK